MSVEPYVLTDAEGATCEGMIKLDGYPMPSFMQDCTTRGKNFFGMRNWKIRDDDVVLATLAKAGTHWVDPILYMLLTRKTELPAERKFTLFDATNEENFEKMPSPRILATHLPPQYLPQQLDEKKTKIVLVLRNLKDAAVSLYYHTLNMHLFNYSGKFKNFLPLFIEGKQQYGDVFSYIREFEEKMNSEPDRICLVMYEDLKMDGVREIQRIARFLGVDANEEFCRAVHESCSFHNMAEKSMPEQERARFFKPGGSFYRKGIIGDWKTHFTVAESEMFDEIFAQRMAGSKLKFTYSAPE
ncbi:sulfotransferase 1B1-like [Dreissena polymorpha]|uniref:Sulfotransferase domain-containing protein n=1 Tax=Dreissena polymorpha TaxID=45954 RepID=A0A9D4I0C9_DREPO|nr:sulfotransferase 1B1-like [Dreissena polymorpha]XP_052238947.1 sulfotransferase 1B1-like [Dreissena polymorpha]XP_052238948.1 sulfotransferase 1B1-like [Dreissena polymorpha]KAH3739252.1 hypothetical protein DPMN_045902 [Dreissena polymorpha]